MSALEVLGALSPLVWLAACALGLRLGKAPPKGDRLR